MLSASQNGYTSNISDNNFYSSNIIGRKIANTIDSQKPELYSKRNDTYSKFDNNNTTEEKIIESEFSSSDRKSLIIYRYKFTEDFMVILFEFSKIHQYDERKDFKEAWGQWTEDNSEIIEGEVTRLKELGYDGDILDKMFKSARYYFRKKSIKKAEPKQRRKYISVNKELLDIMDLHIEENIYNPNYKPQTAFIEFCQQNENVVKEVIGNIMETTGILDKNLIDDKIKKTYKNRYFISVNKNKG
jgi:hypothetical protein